MDFFTYYKLQSIEQGLKRLRHTPTNPFAAQKSDVDALQREVGELRLLVAVLYRVLLDQGQCNEAEIHALISRLDLADGKRDGTFQGDAVSGQPVVNPEMVAEDNGLPKIRVD